MILEHSKIDSHFYTKNQMNENKISEEFTHLKFKSVVFLWSIISKRHRACSDIGKK